MPSATPILDLPYPLGDDDIRDYPATAQLLAEMVEDLLIPIAEQELAAAASTVTFSGIPGTYRHLRMVAKCAKSVAGNGYLYVRANNDATAGLHRTSMLTNHAATVEGFNSDFTVWYAARLWKRTQAVIDFPDYADGTRPGFLSRFFTTYDDGGVSAADGFYNGVAGGFYAGAAAPITRLDFMPDSSTFEAGSIFTLYGMRGTN